MLSFGMEPLSTKLTFINGWYHCRLFNNGELYDELRCSHKSDVGFAFREMMRWYDKCGGMSKWAYAARKRHNEDGNYTTRGTVQKIWKIEGGRGYQYKNIRTEKPLDIIK